MLGATAMMATLAFFQPFKHPDILSINTGAQMVVLMVLFAAMFLLVNRGGRIIIAIVLVLSTLAPLVAGVVMTLRLPKDARVSEAGDTISNDLASLMGSVKDRLGKKTSKAPAAVRDAAVFDSDNPMHVEGRGQAGGAETAAGRESDLVAADENPSRPSSALPEKVVL